MLAILMNRAKVDGQISGVVPHLIDGGLSILQYADDTILFMDHDLEKAQNMKLLLSAFEQVSGFKINFHKSELFCFRNAHDHLINTSKCLALSLVIFQFVIWEFLYILGSLGMLSRGRLRNILRDDWVVGKENIFQLGDA
jgi:hypothetical protein